MLNPAGTNTRNLLFSRHSTILYARLFLRNTERYRVVKLADSSGMLTGDIHGLMYVNTDRDSVQ